MLSRFETIPGRYLSGYAAQDSDVLRQRLSNEAGGLVATIEGRDAFALFKPEVLEQVISAKNTGNEGWAVYLMPSVQFFNSVMSRAPDICMDNAIYGLSEGRGAHPLVCAASFEDAAVIVKNLPQVDEALHEQMIESRKRQAMRPERVPRGNKTADVKLMESWGLKVYPRPEGLSTELVSNGRTLVKFTPPEAANS